MNTANFRDTYKGLLTKIVPRSGAKRNIRYRLSSTDEKSLFTSGEGK